MHVGVDLLCGVAANRNGFRRRLHGTQHVTASYRRVKEPFRTHGFGGCHSQEALSIKRSSLSHIDRTHVGVCTSVEPLRNRNQQGQLSLPSQAILVGAFSESGPSRSRGLLGSSWLLG